MRGQDLRASINKTLPNPPTDPLAIFLSTAQPSRPLIQTVTLVIKPPYQSTKPFQPKEMICNEV